MQQARKIISRYPEGKQKSALLPLLHLAQDEFGGWLDVPAMDYHTQLTKLFGQFRAVGVNYNQIVKILYRNFSEKKAAAYLFKLEKQTVEMASLCRQIIELTLEFESKYLGKRPEK